MFRSAREEDVTPESIPAAWITGIVEAQHRIRDAGVHQGLLLDTLVSSASGLVDAPTRVALLEGDTLVCRAASWDVREHIGVPVPRDGTICGAALDTGLPVRVRDLVSLPPGDPGSGCRATGRSVLVVPLVHEGESSGVIVLSADQPDWFGAADEEAVVMLAATAATALAGIRSRPGEDGPRAVENGTTRAEDPSPRVRPSAADAFGVGPNARSVPSQPGFVADPQTLQQAHRSGQPQAGQPQHQPGQPQPDHLSAAQPPARRTAYHPGSSPQGNQPPPDHRSQVDSSPATRPTTLQASLPCQATSSASTRPASARSASVSPESTRSASDSSFPALPATSPPVSDPPTPATAALSAPVLVPPSGFSPPTEPVAVPPTATASSLPPTQAIPLGMPGPVGLGMWEWHAATGEMTWSEPVGETLGLATGQHVDLDLLRSLLQHGDVARLEEATDRILAGGRVSGSWRVVRPDGVVRYVYAWSEARRSNTGVVTGAWGALVDVTEREQDAAAVRSSLAGLRAAQELTGLGTWEWQPDTGGMAWSPEMYRLVGLDPGDVEPTLETWHRFVHPEDLDRVRRLDVLAADRDGGTMETFRIVGADGVQRHAQSWSIVVGADENGPRAVCGATVDVTRQVHDRQLLERLSATDAITGLANRLAFDRRMQELLSDPTRDVAVLLLDLDRFKMVNDSLGHSVGDQLLVEVARRLDEVVPEGSLTARMGGDEFVIVPRPGLGWLQVRRLAQSIVDSLRVPYVLPESGEMLVCPASVGVTSTSGREVGVTDLLREADLALYRAKDSGRDRYVVFDDVLRARAQSRHRAERQLRQALEQNRLALQYQPIVDFNNGRIVGAEALVRLREEVGDRLLGPDEFIDVAEDTGLVVEVDCWVIDTAIAQVIRWGEALAPGERGPWLAINVSARSMEHPRVIRRILDAVKQGRVPRHRIKIELTEHSFLGALPGGESSLRQLLGSGIPVA